MGDYIRELRASRKRGARLLESLWSSGIGQYSAVAGARRAKAEGDSSWRSDTTVGHVPLFGTSGPRPPAPCAPARWRAGSSRAPWPARWSSHKRRWRGPRRPRSPRPARPPRPRATSLPPRSTTRTARRSTRRATTPARSPTSPRPTTSSRRRTPSVTSGSARTTWATTRPRPSGTTSSSPMSPTSSPRRVTSFARGRPRSTRCRARCTSTRRLRLRR